MTNIQIEGHKIGPGHPCFIIAEAGVNHNGSIELARQLIDAAASAGAHAVKFQTFSADELVTKSAPLADYQQRILGTSDSQFAMLKQLELDRESRANRAAGLWVARGLRPAGRRILRRRTSIRPLCK